MQDFARNLTKGEIQRQRVMDLKEILLKSVGDWGVLPVSPTLKTPPSRPRKSKDSAVTREPALPFNHLLPALNSLSKHLKFKRKIMFKYELLGQVVQKHDAKKPLQ